MPDLFGELWELTLLPPFLVTWGIWLVPPLFIRFVLMRRPMGDGWALLVATLFWIFNLALFSALSPQTQIDAAFVLIAIISYLLLTAGKKERAPVFEKSESSEPKAASPNSEATGEHVPANEKDEFPKTFSVVDTDETVEWQPPGKPEAPKIKELRLSEAEDEAELRRYDAAWRELETGNTHRGLWGRAFAKTDGDEHKAKAQYLKERIEFLKNVEQRQDEQRKAQKLREREIQKQKDRERQERMEKLSKQMRGQDEEGQYRDLLKRIAQEQSEKVDMLKEGINKPDKWNEFKLISAAQLGSDETVLALLAAGANPLLRDSFGYTARDYAEQKGRTEIAQQLAIAERLWQQKIEGHRSTAA